MTWDRRWWHAVNALVTVYLKKRVIPAEPVHARFSVPEHEDGALERAESLQQQ